MTPKLMWSLKNFSLGILLFLFACQLPGKLVRTISQMRRTVSPTQNARATISVSELPLSPYPRTKFVTSYPILSTGTAYPGPDGTLQPPGVNTVNPEKITQTIVSEESTADQSGYITGTHPISVTITPTSTETLLVTASEGTSSASPTQQTVGGYPNPGSEIQPFYTSYPGAESSSGLNSTQYSAYPSPGETTTSYSPSPTITFSPTGRLTGTTTPSRKPTDIALTTTPILSTAQPQSSTPVPTVFLVPTATLTPTKTPFQTPTPTLTPTPTITRTPLPFPPWINSKLSSTDPRTVQLASGRVQLVEFFAYWSGPSQAMAPLLLGLEKEYIGRVYFIYLDIDNPANITFKRQLGFQMEPQFFLLDPQGKILKQWIGYVTVEQLRMAFDTALH